MLAERKCFKMLDLYTYCARNHGAITVSTSDT